MATLNQTETESLRTVQSYLAGITRRLSDPKSITDEEREQIKTILKQADDRVRTVISMKGYYGK